MAVPEKCLAATGLKYPILWQLSNFESHLSLHTGAHPASCTVGTGGFSPGGKALPGRDAVHSPPSSAEVKKE
jgi:hypothetical protein